MDNGRIMKELKELIEGVKNVSFKGKNWNITIMLAGNFGYI
jgi:hypothetical protein